MATSSSVYSTRFLSNYIAGSGTVAFAVPEGFRAVVRDIEIFETPPGGAIGELAGEFGIVFWGFGPNLTSTYNYSQWQGRLVIDYPWQLECTTTLAVNVYASGYLLSLP